MINIFNFKKYFKRLGDNQRARVGHVNHLFPLTGAGNPIANNIKPTYIGQRYISSNPIELWISVGTTSNDWVLCLID